MSVLVTSIADAWDRLSGKALERATAEADSLRGAIAEKERQLLEIGAAFEQLREELAAKEADLARQGEDAARLRDELSAARDAIEQQARLQAVMPLSLRRRPILFLHISKTAGMSMFEMFRQQLPGLVIYRGNLSDIDASNAHRFGIFADHFSFSDTRRVPDPKFMFTFLRDPVERVLSTYFYLRRFTGEVVGQHVALAHALSLEDFVRCEHPDVMTFVHNHQTYALGSSYLTHRTNDEEQLAAAKNNLAQFDFVGFVERYEDDVARLWQALGLPAPEIPRQNKTEGRATQSDVGPDVIEDIIARNRLDIELYRHAWAMSPHKDEPSPVDHLTEAA